MFDKTLTEQSYTGPVQMRAVPGRRRRLPALLVAGHAGVPSALSPSLRIVTFERTLIVGRRPPPESAVGDIRVWALPDGRVSSVHARIDRAAGDGDEPDVDQVAGAHDFQIQDLGSTNGTTVDGVPLNGKPLRLREGAVIFVGHHVMVFRTVTDPELTALRREMSAPFGPVPMIAPPFVAMTDKLRRLAIGSGEILLVGETGVGKEVYANAIHRASGREGKFVAVNCAAIPRELVESELFGFVRGAHSQAREGKEGLIEEADGGTLFLDEIGEMAPELQAKLLRFAQDRLVMPVGSTQARHIDTRLLAATNRIEVATSADSLGVRLDLVARLGAEPMRLPPLREHVEDIGALVGFFLRRCERRMEPAAFRALCLHHWPGNVRELEKALQEAEVLSRGSSLVALEHLPSRIAERAERTAAGPAPSAGDTPAPAARHRRPPTAPELETLLKEHRGNMTHVARALDRQPALVYRWLERFKLDPAAFRVK